jgi:hypothetical protein
MAYSKLPKICQDYGWGFRSFNQLRDNIDQVRADFDVGHTVPGAGKGLAVPASLSAIATWVFPGVHDDLAIPRAVLLAGVSSGEAYEDSGTDNFFSGFTRTGTGIYVLESRFLGSASHCLIQALATTTGQVRLPVARIGGYGPFTVQAILVTLTELSGGDFIAADYAFSLTLFRRDSYP